jgi:hypothetical protein
VGLCLLEPPAAIFAPRHGLANRPKPFPLPPAVVLLGVCSSIARKTGAIGFFGKSGKSCLNAKRFQDAAAEERKAYMEGGLYAWLS